MLQFIYRYHSCQPNNTRYYMDRKKQEIHQCGFEGGVLVESNINYMPLATLPLNRQQQRTMGNHQLVIFTQLLRVAPNMQHIDELLHWLGHTLIQRLELEAIQFWTQQNTTSGVTNSELRVMACRNASQPQQLLAQHKIVTVAEQLLTKRHGSMPQATYPSLFTTSSSTAHEHNNHQLNFWSSYHLHTASLIPPMRNTSRTGQVSTPLNMLILLFTAQQPTSRLLPTLGNIMEQALSHANKCQLLTPVSPQSTLTQLPLLLNNLNNTLPLMELVPRKTTEEEEGGDYAVEPSSTISNRQARRLYLAIDGRRNLTHLSTLIQLNGKALWQALYMLLVRKYIRLQEPDGQFVDSIRVLATL